MDGRGCELAVALLVAAVATVAILKWKPRLTTSVTISSLIIYPIKSCRSVQVLTANIDYRGLKNDRTYMFVCAKGGKCVTSREYPAIALIAPDLPTDDGVVIRFQHVGVASISQQELVVYVPRPNKSVLRDVAIWGTPTVAEDQGDEIARIATEWLRAVYSSIPDLRLVRQTDEHKRPANELHAPGRFVSFCDGLPMVLLSEASLSAINRRCGIQDSPARFRPNIVVRGSQMWEEDQWTELIGEGCGVHFQFLKPCSRCIMPNINPATGDTRINIVKMLRNFRLTKHVLAQGSPHEVFLRNEECTTTFVGQNVCARSDVGFVRVGDSFRPVSRQCTI